MPITLFDADHPPPTVFDAWEHGDDVTRTLHAAIEDGCNHCLSWTTGSTPLVHAMFLAGRTVRTGDFSLAAETPRGWMLEPSTMYVACKTGYLGEMRHESRGIVVLVFSDFLYVKPELQFIHDLIVTMVIPLPRDDDGKRDDTPDPTLPRVQPRTPELVR